MQSMHDLSHLENNQTSKKHHTLGSLELAPSNKTSNFYMIDVPRIAIHMLIILKNYSPFAMKCII